MADVVIVSGLRTPFCPAGGPMQHLTLEHLGKLVVAELLERTDFPTTELDQLIFGAVGVEPSEDHLAGSVARRAGLQTTTCASRVERGNSSGLQALIHLYALIRTGGATSGIAAAGESLSNVDHHPFHAFTRELATQKLLSLARAGRKSAKRYLAVDGGGLSPRKFPYAAALESLCRKYGIGRQAQEGFTLMSFQRALQARDSGRLLQDRCIIYEGHSKEAVLENDCNLEARPDPRQIQQLAPVFDPRFGMIPMGAVAPAADGAAALLLMSAQRAKTLGYEPLATVKCIALSSADRKEAPLAGVLAAVRALTEVKMRLPQIDLIEHQDIYAAEVLLTAKLCNDKSFLEDRLGKNGILAAIEKEKVNVNGGALALGHPLGATGLRMVITLAREMEQRHLRTGLLLAAVEDGGGVAIVLERS